MFRPLEVFIGLRYTRAARRRGFLSFISTVSIVCIALSVMALITVMSVMNGFDSQMRTRTLGAISHVTVTGNGEAPGWAAVIGAARAQPHVVGVAPYVETQAMLLTGSQASGALVRGVDPVSEAAVDDIGRHMTEGSLADLTLNSWHLVLGRDLAATLGVHVGDRVTVAVQSSRSGPMGAVPRMRSFQVVGTFSMGMATFDQGLALMNLRDAAILNSLSGPNGVRVRLDDLFQAPAVADRIAARIGSDDVRSNYRVQTWMTSNANLLHALALEKKVMGIILSLIVLVAVINLISMLMMLVTDKQADIAILRTLGSSPGSIMGVFMIQGLGIGVLGLFIGVMLGCLFSWQLPHLVQMIEHIFHVTLLSPDIYYISEVPSELRGSDVVWISGLTFVLAWLATLYPAWRAARLAPAEALSHA